jgi:hypothetical protein
MGIARHIALHRAQAETLGGVVAGVLHPSVIEDQRLGPAAFEEQLAILRPVGRLPQEASARRIGRDGSRKGERALTWRLRKAGTGKMIQVNFVLGETFLTNVLPVP